MTTIELKEHESILIKADGAPMIVINKEHIDLKINALGKFEIVKPTNIECTIREWGG